MEKVYISGKMEENIKDNIAMIKNMVLGHILGQMVENIVDNGKILKDTEEVRLFLWMVVKGKVFGNKIKGLLG